MVTQSLRTPDKWSTLTATRHHAEAAPEGLWRFRRVSVLHCAMPPITYYVAIPFIPDAEGNLSPGEAVECPGATSASRKAMGLAEKYGGAIAFQRTGEPDVGEFKDAVMLGKYGKTPEDLSEL